MATNVAGRRYRTWYAMLLRLYPRPFRERFGEGMAQTFHDLCREHRDARRGLFGLALWIFFETSVGIVRENTTHMSQLGKTMLRVALGALGSVDGAARGIAGGGGMELARGSFRVRVCPVLRDGDGVCADREEDGRVVVQGGRWCGAGGRVRLGVVQHGPCRGLGKSGEPGVLQRARGGGRWGLAGAAGGARVGSHVVRDGGDACADCRDAAFGRAARPVRGIWPSCMVSSWRCSPRQVCCSGTRVWRD